MNRKPEMNGLVRTSLLGVTCLGLAATAGMSYLIALLLWLVLAGLADFFFDD